MSRTRLGVALLTGAALALVLLAAAAAQPRAHARYGGTLYVGFFAEPDALDPSLSMRSQSVEVYRTICEKLYDFDQAGNLVPQLAAALPIVSKDKLTYSIPVRRGVLFNDGTPFNAQAVVTSIQRHQTIEGSSRASDLLAVASVTAAGPYTVVLHLSSRYTLLPQTLATSSGSVMSPAQLAKLGDKFATDPVCVGPFMFDNRVVGDSVTVVKSPYYYDRYAVHVDKIVFKVAVDNASRAAALKAGDLQVAENLAEPEVPSVERTPGLRVIQRKQLGWNGIVINIGNRNGLGNRPYVNVGTPLASSPLLRQAFEEAIDRPTLVRVLFGGLAQPGCTWAAPTSPTFDGSIRCTPYNPAHAKKLVAASGVRDPTVHLLLGGAGSSTALAQFIQAQEAAVGINVVIDSTSTPIRDARAVSGEFEVIIAAWTGSPDVDRSIFQWLHTSGSRNWSGYSNPRLDLILANSRKATNPAALKTLYHAAAQIVLADRPIIYLFHETRFTGVSASVTGVEVGPDILLRVAFAQLD